MSIKAEDCKPSNYIVSVRPGNIHLWLLGLTSDEQIVFRTSEEPKFRRIEPYYIGGDGIVRFSTFTLPAIFIKDLEILDID